jgi:Fe-S-cluster containining protein
MGEAKRRREAGHKPRIAGRSFDILMQYFRVAEQHEAGNHNAAAQVPCNDCRACCYQPGGVNVAPEKEPPERLPHLRLQWNEERQFHELLRREDGACVHLGPEGCTIYEHRPEVCRRHDCRVPAIWGLHLVYDEGQSAPWWEFTDKGADRKVLEARQTAGKRLLLEKGQPGVVDVPSWIAETEAYLQNIWPTMGLRPGIKPEASGA